MHQSSYDRMAEFCRDYLGTRRDQPLTIVDLGSCDYNGTYRPIFAQPPWRYLGVDLSEGKNVDLVLRDPYRWRELKTESVDVLVSGQTFEHAEFFWETMLEIARVLKPQGLCCIIAPATGHEHRVPLDCWRFFTDGFRALARYARLEVLHSRTHWEESAKYDADSNQWHESILIARKPPQTFETKLRRALDRIITPRLRPLPQKSEALIQVFYSTDGAFYEEKSIIAAVEPGSWEEVHIDLSDGAARALRIDFMGPFHLVEIAELRVGTSEREYFLARSNEQFDLLKIAGDAERVPHPTSLRLQITGPDPQLYLPKLELPDESPRRVQVYLRVRF